MRIHDSPASISLLALNTCDCGAKYKVTVIEALTNDVTFKKCGTLMDSRRNNPDRPGGSVKLVTAGATRRRPSLVRFPLGAR